MGVYLVLTPWWKPLERVTAHEWLSRWAGQRGYKALREPLLIGKFGEDNCSRREYGLDVGAHPQAHPAPGHVRRRLSGVL